jgi:S-adenosyl methyltransferase
MTAPSDGAFPEVSSALPVPARMYDYCLGGTNNYEVDRAAVLAAMQRFPWGANEARGNRQFLYRVVRFLARDAGIRQFLDLGSGLPTQNNVHQVAQQFQPDARVVYVDNDPTVLAYGRALLATDERTIVIAADLTMPKEILEHPQVRELLDLSQPVAVLFLSIGHLIMDDAVLESVLATVRDAIVAGSYLAYSQMCVPDRQTIEESKQLAAESRYEWQNRLPQQVVDLLRGLEPVEPGLVYVRDWRPDPSQPPLPDVDEQLCPYVGIEATPDQGGEFGGVARKP